MNIVTQPQKSCSVKLLCRDARLARRQLLHAHVPNGGDGVLGNVNVIHLELPAQRPVLHIFGNHSFAPCRLVLTYQ
jgi:hypothetical protein